MFREALEFRVDFPRIPSILVKKGSTSPSLQISFCWTAGCSLSLLVTVTIFIFSIRLDWVNWTYRADQAFLVRLYFLSSPQSIAWESVAAFIIDLLIVVTLKIVYINAIETF